MQHYLINRSLGICFAIFAKASPDIRGLRSETSVNEDSEKLASVDLNLFDDAHGHSFAKVEVNAHQFDNPGKKPDLYIEVFAELQIDEFEGITGIGDVVVQGIIDEYKGLRPIISEGIIHYLDDLTNPQNPMRKATRKFGVRYKIHAESYIQDEDSFYGYNNDEIAETTIPYLKSLLKLRDRLVIEFGTN